MTGKWEVASHPVAQKDGAGYITKFSLYRAKDTGEPDHSGNRESLGRWMGEDDFEWTAAERAAMWHGVRDWLQGLADALNSGAFGVEAVACEIESVYEESQRRKADKAAF